MYEAKDLKSVDVVRASDPYVDVVLGGKSMAKTRVISSSQNPYFNEYFYVLVHSMNDLLELRVRCGICMYRLTASLGPR